MSIREATADWMDISFYPPRYPALAVAPAPATVTHRHHHTHARPNPHRHLVSFETSPRIIRHEPTYQMIRASNDDCECRDDSLQTRSDTHSAARNRQEQHDMRHVRNPVSEKCSDAPKRCPTVDNDIDIGRQRHPHRPMRMNKGK